jgi:outer membrane protein assembly factor BamB
MLVQDHRSAEEAPPMPMAARPRAPSRRTAGGIVAALLAGLVLPAIARAQPDSIFVSLRVFHDLDGDGVRQGGEPGLAEIRFTNGEEVRTTGAEGELDLWVDRAVYRFATMTIPAGFWPTTPWYHWVPRGRAGPDTVEFGLKTNGATAADPVQWVHVTDTHVKTWGDEYTLESDLVEINELDPPPAFVINTGDIVQTGSDTTHWNNYVAQVAVSNSTVFNVVGNHDTVGTATPFANYEQWAGPPYYSFEVGSWHLMVYNDWVAAVGTPMQNVWWDADLAATHSGRHLAMYQHQLLKESTTDVVAGWVADGILASFSGHWHSLQLTDRPEGIAEYNLSRTRAGPLDWTPRVFGLATFQSDGSIDYELRRLAVDHRAEITYPQNGQAVGGASLEVHVQAYDTSSLVASLSATVSGLGGSAGPVALAQEGISLWRGTLDVSSLPDGEYSVTVTGSFADATSIAVTSPFIRAAVEPIQPMLRADWPMFRKVPAGSSYVAEELAPPLELAWSTPVAGLIALNSPVVANSTVYLGTRPERDPTEGGVIACDAVTGAIDWFTHVPGGVALAPAVAGNVVLVTAMTDSIYGLDATTGAILWSIASPASRYQMTAPVFIGNDAWVGGEPNPMQIDPLTGARDWQATYLGIDWFPYIYSAPAVGASYVYYGFFGTVGTNTGGLAVVDRATGIRQSLDEGTYRSPIWTGTTLYVVGGAVMTDQKLTARDELGNVLWTSPVNLGTGTGSPALAADIVVVAGRNGTVEGLSAVNGARLWSHYVEPELYDMIDGLRHVSGTTSTPAIAGEVVWIGSLDGRLYALDLATGAELWSWYFGTPVASSAAVSGNTLFVGASDGHVYAFVGAPLGATGVETSPGGATVFTFYPPRPNPSQAATHLSWVMPERAWVRIDIFDIGGRRVRTVVDEERAPGEHWAVWDGQDRLGKEAAPGVYFARISTGTQTAVRKVVRLRR